MNVTATPAIAKLTFFKIVDASSIPAGNESGNTSADAPWETEAAAVPIARRISNAQRSAVQLFSPEGKGTAGFRALGFDGISAAYSTFVGRPDQAIAVGPGGILQSINTGIALYDTRGRLAPGWPKNPVRVFGLPVTHHLVDPRAAYDGWDHRYWLAFLDQESKGVYYLAVSQSSNPNGKWSVYGFLVADGDKQYPDFTMFGLDRRFVSISSHLLTFVTRRKFTLSNGIFVIPKAALESGSSNVAATGFVNIAVGGTNLDTIQPVSNRPGEGQPPGELFAGTYGFNFPCTTGKPSPCSQMFAFMISLRGSQAVLTHAIVAVPPYTFTPSAGTPACSYCLEAVGPTMSTPPVYSRGLIDFAFGVGVPSPGKYGVPAIFWGQLRPAFSGGLLTGATLVQQGTMGFAANQAAIFPSVMSDPRGNFYLLFDGTGSLLDPSVYVAAHRVGDPPGVMTSIQLVKSGRAAPPKPYSSYGDFTAASYDPKTGVWFASEYALSTENYGTYIVNVRP